MTDELLGYTRTGGLGTATTFLALALGRMGHRVELLHVGTPPETALGAEWARLYAAAGVMIRSLPRSDATVEPSYFTRMRDVELALAADPPDVVITQDLAAPAYTAIRLRHLGLGFDHTLFVVYCHGTRQWITDAARKVRVLPGALGVTVLEQASLELADVVVSPSQYVVDWMRQQGWPLPAAAHVIPHLTRAAATGEPQPRAETTAERVRRVAFFGRLEERKGIRPFIAGVNALPAELLEDLEIEFIGRATPSWTPERVEALLSTRAKLSFETNLDQPEALARLARPGTLAVMPSFEETFGNTVRECLDYGIPFIASDAAAIGELVAPEDRARVLFEPTGRGVEVALRQALAGADALRPARAAFDAEDSLAAWAAVVETPPQRRGHAEAEPPDVDVVVVQRRSDDALARCLAALTRQNYANFGVIVAASGSPDRRLPEINGRVPLVVTYERPTVQDAREAALAAAAAPFVLFLDEDDEPEAELLASLVRAQRVSGADVVSCGVRLRDETRPALHFFHGQPGGLGLVANGYGTVALLRRSLLDELTTRRPVENDADWPLLAGLSVAGARIVSVPAALVTRSARPGTIERQPSDALLVVERLERALPDALRSLARLAAGLAAAANERPAASVRRGRRAVLRRVVRRSP